MKYFLIVSLFICFFAINIFAQDSTQNSLKQNKFALQFQIGGNFSLRSFQGTIFSCKYHIYDNSALRFGFSLSSNTEIFHTENDNSRTNAEFHTFGINIQYIKYLKTVEDISLFVGTGPHYYRYFYKSSSSSSYGSNNWYLGLSGIIGVEWFFKKNMSLSAEYGLLIYYQKYLDTNQSGNTTHNIESINTTDNDMLKFGISIYI